MKKLLYILALVLISAMPTMAQQGKNQIESVRAAFLTQKLDLTSEESQKFWPVYNSYHHELQQLVSKKHKQRKENKSESKSEVDELEIDSEILELRKRYRREFEKVLPSKKAAMVYPAEREFRQELIEHLRSRKSKD